MAQLAFLDQKKTLKCALKTLIFDENFRDDGGG